MSFSWVSDDLGSFRILWQTAFSDIQHPLRRTLDAQQLWGIFPETLVSAVPGLTKGKTVQGVDKKKIVTLRHLKGIRSLWEGVGER